MKQAVILAGGKGTRLAERLKGLPKPLIDICGVPLLERQILLLKAHGFTHVLVLVNHAAQHIVDFCASKGNWGLDVRCIDDGEPRGTAGATLAVFDQLAEEFLVMYGDTMMQVDLTRFHAFHREVDGVGATLFLHPNDHPHDSDLVEIDDDGSVTQFHPYPHDPSRYYPNLVNAALYWINRGALAPWRSDTRFLDFGKDFFPEMLRAGVRLRGYNSPEYIKDVGTPARVDKVSGDFLSGKIARASLDHPQAIVFLDRDGTINHEVGHLKSVDQFELLPGVAQAIKRLNKSEYRLCVVTNQPVIARGDCSVEDLRQIHNKMETLLGREGAFVDRIFYCPHHPDKGFPGERAELKIACDCRKPATGMVDRAVNEFNAARDRCWFVGDTTVDLEVAARAGVRSILVETGNAGFDYRHWTLPDATVPDLAAAVDYILDVYPRLLAEARTLVANVQPGEVVLVGGHARSGKSSFASVLRDVLAERGIAGKVVSMDRWLLDDNDRGPGVLGRYDMARLKGLARMLADSPKRPTNLQLPAYDKRTRSTKPNVATLPLSQEDVVIIEGTVALALAPDAVDSPHCVHVAIDEEERRRRMLREYSLRGARDDEALAVYLSRMADEYPVIEGLAASARRVVMPNPTPREPHA